MSNKLLKETDTKKRKKDKIKKHAEQHTSEKAVSKLDKPVKEEKHSTKMEHKEQKTADDKVLTKYDKKVLKRKQEQLRAAKTRKITVVSLIAIAVIAIAGAAIGIWSNYDKVHNRYIAIDDDSVSQIEFDFYYNVAKQSMLNQTLYENITYKSYFESYMGYDSSKPDQSQKYSSSDNTWYDYFANNTLTTLKEHEALLKDADQNGYDYTDGDSDYEAFCADITEAAGKAGQSVADYYKTTFGSHATQSNLKPYIYEYLKATAYQEKLNSDMTPSDSEVAEYYEQNKETYDTVTYRSFDFKAEDKTSDASKATAKSSAEAMLAAVTDEDSFVELCRKNASSDDAEKYEDETGSLSNEVTKTSMSTPVATWMYDDSRTVGNKDMVEDADNGTYTVVYFISRQKPDTVDQTIKSTLLNKKYTDLISGYTNSMTFNNIKNRVKTMNK